jgi:hypothetical protein
MIGLTRPRALWCAAFAVVVLMLCAVPAAMAGLSEEPKSLGGYTAQPFATFEQELSSHKVASVVFFKKLRTIRITLKDGRKYVARYPKKQSEVWEAKIRHARAVSVKATPEQQKQLEKETKAAGGGKPHKHKIRYIVGGVVILLIVIGVVVLLLRRRRQVD